MIYLYAIMIYLVSTMIDLAGTVIYIAVGRNSIHVFLFQWVLLFIHTALFFILTLL